MTTAGSRAIAAAMAVCMCGALPALADRPPTEEERGRLEQALRGLGFQSWEEIERDDDHWEIDDARHSDGTTYDLKLHLETLQVIKQEKD